MAQANYQAYLESIYPGTTWRFDRLSGGLVNSTLRAVKISGDAPHSSLIIKHARPYVEVAGPDWAFSTDRQAVEATVLALWDESGLLYETRRKLPAWHSPRCLRHDQGKESALKLTDSEQEASVLILNDLGELINILDFLKACARNPNIVTLDQVAEIGRTIGKVFAAVHSPETVAKIKAVPQVMTRLTHSFTDDIVMKAAVEPIRERVGTFSNAEKLYARVVEDFTMPKYSYQESLVLGDFTHGTILMQPPSAGSDLTPTVVDWEFAKINGRGVNGDMSQFLANVHLELLAVAEDTLLHGLLSCFISALCTSYRDGAGLIYQKLPDDGNLQLLRSSFIMHGREIINQAHDLYHDNLQFKDMVSVGVWYIERAKDSSDEFLQEDNWDMLTEEHCNVIQSLFTKSL